MTINICYSSLLSRQCKSPQHMGRTSLVLKVFIFKSASCCQMVNRDGGVFDEIFLFVTGGEESSGGDHLISEFSADGGIAHCIDEKHLSSRLALGHFPVALGLVGDTIQALDACFNFLREMIHGLGDIHFVHLVHHFLRVPFWFLELLYDLKHVALHFVVALGPQHQILEGG